MDKMTRIFLVVIIFIAGLILIIKNSNSLVDYAKEKFQSYDEIRIKNAVDSIKATKMNKLADVILLGRDYRKLEKDVRKRFTDL